MTVKPREEPKRLRSFEFFCCKTIGFGDDSGVPRCASSFWISMGCWWRADLASWNRSLEEIA
jgi:hypothetical protein